MSRKYWSAEELRALDHLYPETSPAALAARFGCSERAVYTQAAARGLRKSEVYMARLHSGNQLSESGAATRFHKGHVPHNAGQKGWQAGGRSAQTQFKKGQKPRGWRPVGSERITKDGLVQVKMTDTGYPPRDWLGKHRVIWEAENGPMPKGHIVVFVNGNRRDFRIENLECISRAENMRRNSVHRLPKELAQVVLLMGAVQRQINKRTKA